MDAPASTWKAHDSAVVSLSTQIKSLHSLGRGFKIYHGSTNSTRITSFAPSTSVDMSAFTRILRISPTTKTCIIEPNVPMDALVSATLAHGLVPPVVMEFPGITAGGGFAGVAGESSSWKHGFFDRTVNWIDMVLPNGAVERCDTERNREIFEGAPGTYGTLGATTLLEVRLVEAKKYVDLSYVTVGSADEAARRTRESMKEASWEFIDGIMFSPTRGVLMLGNLSNSTPTPSKRLQRFSRPWNPWFYLHADSVSKHLSTSSKKSDTESHHSELIPLTDYLFRYDRGAFWTGRYAFSRFHVPFNVLTRLLLDWYMHTRRMYTALNVSGFSQQYVIQDIALPFPSVAPFVDWLDEKLPIYPLWLCPLRMDNAGAVPLRAKVQQAVADSSGDDGIFMLNVGVWGPGPRKHAAFVEVNREFEKVVKEWGGFKWLYANAYYTEKEFWSIYDRDWYEGLRKMVGAEFMPSVWEKTRAKEERVRQSKHRGVWVATFGRRGQHLLKKME